MNHPVIRVEGLGKEYVIGARDVGGETFREMLVSSVAAPLRRLRRLQGAVARQERIWALKDVSFEVAEGEVVGIIGRNGAGKSTLLKILSRITDPTEGRAEIRGRVASLLEVGTGFHPELTGRENIYLNGAILGMTRTEVNRKFDEIVDFAEVSKFIDMPVKRYSSGMYVRLAFSVAAHVDTEVLIVDEVLAVGDASFQRKCLGSMQAAAQSGRTVLFVSHNMNAIRRFCTRGILVQEGSVADDGGPEGVISNFMRTQDALPSGGSGSFSFEKSCRYLERLEIRTARDLTAAVIPYEESFSLEVTFTAPSEAQGFILAVRITDALGNALFTSWDTDAISKEGIVKGRRYEERCTVPSHLLRPGYYTLMIMMRLQAHGFVSFEETADVGIEISDIGFLQGQGRWGLVAPKLHWTIDAV